MSGDVQVRFCERPGVKFPRATHRNIYVSSERGGQRVMASIVRFIERRLRLKVNAEKSAVSRPGKRHFVGFSVWREPRTGDIEVRLSKRSFSRIGDKVGELTPRTWGQSLRDCITRLNAYLLGWIGFFRIVSRPDGRYSLVWVDAHIRRRLRAIVLRHWRKRNDRRWRRTAPGRRSWWALSHVTRVEAVLSRKFFESRGLISLETEWRDRQTQSVLARAQLDAASG